MSTRGIAFASVSSTSDDSDEAEGAMLGVDSVEDLELLEVPLRGVLLPALLAELMAVDLESIGLLLGAVEVVEFGVRT